MNFHVLTLFPEMIEQGINTSITGRAIEKGLISLNAINIRDYAGNKHGQVDDYPYGGGAGMVMQPGPVYRSYESVTEKIDTSQGLYILHHKARFLIRVWQKNFPKKKIWYFSVDIMRE